MSRPPASPGSPGPDQQKCAAAPAPDVAEHELWTAAMSSEPASPDREGVATAAEFTAEFAEHATPPAWAQEGAAAEEGSDTAEALGPLSPERLRSVLESLLFAAERPLTVQRIVELLEETAAAPREPSGPPLYQAAQIKDVLTELGRELQAGGRGIELHEVAGGWQLRTAAQNAPWVQRLLQAKPVRLSRAQVETLAIVAYRQPVTRGDIEDIRGVTVSSQIVKQLEERGWIDAIGYREAPGRPALYATTRQFLDDLGLASLDQLPPLEGALDGARGALALAALEAPPLLGDAQVDLPLDAAGETESTPEPAPPCADQNTHSVATDAQA